MLSVRACQTGLLLAALAVTPAVASRTHRAPTSGHHKASSKKAKPVSHVITGQRGIDSDRAREIQTALIREKYLTGEPSGEWDSETQSAMLKYQADHGWQTKLTPDSRALIKLGLGPTQSTPPATAAIEARNSETSTPAASEAPNTLASIRTIQN